MSSEASKRYALLSKTLFGALNKTTMMLNVFTFSKFPPQNLCFRILVASQSFECYVKSSFECCEKPLTILLRFTQLTDQTQVYIAAFQREFQRNTKCLFTENAEILTARIARSIEMSNYETSATLSTNAGVETTVSLSFELMQRSFFKVSFLKHLRACFTKSRSSLSPSNV